MTAPTDQELIDFVIREARLIDQQRFEEWLDLFAEDGIYWMPLEWGQTDTRLSFNVNPLLFHNFGEDAGGKQ